MNKIKVVDKGQKVDLSSGEDLSMAIMNLIAIEEHMFFNGNKTGKIKYFDLLHETRKMRTDLMKMIVKDPEAEIWCTSKHLLAASMRIMEVGTKAQTKGDHMLAHNLFKNAYDLYNLFWSINLGAVKDVAASSAETQIGDSVKNQPFEYKKNEFLGRLSNTIGKILDCCRE
jgi:hypothetical protein